jgi:hypothetical protein
MADNIHWIHKITIGEAKKTTILLCKNCDFAYIERDFEKTIENNNGCINCGKNEFEKKTLLSKNK